MLIFIFHQFPSVFSLKFDSISLMLRGLYLRDAKKYLGDVESYAGTVDRCADKLCAHNILVLY